MKELLDWVAPAVEVLLRRGIDWKRYCIAAALPLPVREGNFSDDGRTLISGGSTGRTVQIVQFHTFDDPIKALVSDGHTNTEVEFSKSAADMVKTQRGFDKPGYNMTDNAKGGLLHLKNFDVVASIKDRDPKLHLLISSCSWIGGEGQEIMGRASPLKYRPSIREIFGQLAGLREAQHEERRLTTSAQSTDSPQSQIGRKSSPETETQSGEWASNSQQEFATQVPQNAALSKQLSRYNRQSSSNCSERQRKDPLESKHHMNKPREFTPARAVPSNAQLLKLLQSHQGAQHERHKSIEQARTSTERQAQTMPIGPDLTKLAGTETDRPRPSTDLGTMQARRDEREGLESYKHVSHAHNAPDIKSSPMSNNMAHLSKETITSFAKGSGAASHKVDSSTQPKTSQRNRQEEEVGLRASNEKSVTDLSTVGVSGVQRDPWLWYDDEDDPWKNMTKISLRDVRIPKDQEKLLRKKSCWIPAELGTRGPSANIPQDLFDHLNAKADLLPNIYDVHSIRRSTGENPNSDEEQNSMPFLDEDVGTARSIVTSESEAANLEQEGSEISWEESPSPERWGHQPPPDSDDETVPTRVRNESGVGFSPDADTVKPVVVECGSDLANVPGTPEHRIQKIAMMMARRSPTAIERDMSAVSPIPRVDRASPTANIEAPANNTLILEKGHSYRETEQGEALPQDQYNHDRNSQVSHEHTALKCSEKLTLDISTQTSSSNEQDLPETPVSEVYSQFKTKPIKILSPIKRSPKRASYEVSKEVTSDDDIDELSLEVTIPHVLGEKGAPPTSSTAPDAFVSNIRGRQLDGKRQDTKIDKDDGMPKQQVHSGVASRENTHSISPQHGLAPQNYSVEITKMKSDKSLKSVSPSYQEKPKPSNPRLLPPTTLKRPAEAMSDNLGRASKRGVSMPSKPLNHKEEDTHLSRKDSISDKSYGRSLSSSSPQLRQERSQSSGLTAATAKEVLRSTSHAGNAAQPNSLHGSGVKELSTKDRNRASEQPRSSSKRRLADTATQDERAPISAGTVNEVPPKRSRTLYWASLDGSVNDLHPPRSRILHWASLAGSELTPPTTTEKQKDGTPLFVSETSQPPTPSETPFATRPDATPISSTMRASARSRSHSDSPSAQNVQSWLDQTPDAPSRKTEMAPPPSPANAVEWWQDKDAPFKRFAKQYSRLKSVKGEMGTVDEQTGLLRPKRKKIDVLGWDL
ncbi:MAG: hypothetical protein M1824_005690 [Vezdaea acicularis]|nr:MAG: hypothetical protein M1824_005690 [Vezdaea acicularis]